MIISRNADQTDQCWTKGVTIDDCSPVCVCGGGGGGGTGGREPERIEGGRDTGSGRAGYGRREVLTPLLQYLQPPTAIPATKPISYEENTRGAKKKNKRSTQNASQSDGTVLIRRLVFISTAVVAVAFLTAAATLILALSLIMSRNDRIDNTSAKDLKDCGAIYGKYSHKLFFTACNGQKCCNLLKLHMSIISPKSKSRRGQK